MVAERGASQARSPPSAAGREARTPAPLPLSDANFLGEAFRQVHAFQSNGWAVPFKIVQHFGGNCSPTPYIPLSGRGRRPGKFNVRDRQCWLGLRASFLTAVTDGNVNFHISTEVPVWRVYGVPERSLGAPAGDHRLGSAG